MAFKFENLRVWQDSIELSGKVHKLIQTFPKHEMYVLSSQIMRAADSVALNIAEGSTGQSNAEFRRFLNMANRSALEVISCLYLAKKRNLIDETRFRSLYDETEGLVKSIQALRRSIV